MSSTSMTAQQMASFLSAGAEYLDELYESYLDNPNSVSAEWRTYFTTLPTVGTTPEVSHRAIRHQFEQYESIPVVKGGVEASAQRQVDQLISAFRRLGHLAAHTNPLSHERVMIPELQLLTYGLSESDFKTEFDSCGLMGRASLASIYQSLCQTYTSTIGVEIDYLTHCEEVQWLQSYVEQILPGQAFSNEEKTRLLAALQKADGLEKYLGNKYVGQKRFSLEGADSFIPLVQELIEKAAASSTEEVVIGMAHRGRLNLLINIMGQPAASLFKTFEGTKEIGETSGDVKYHMGYSSDVKTAAGSIHLSLLFNPSHLEIVSPVVLGAVRAREDMRADEARRAVLPVIVHGDAAFSGQGIVMETLNMSQTRAHRVGGSIHIVINNQVGFTTDLPEDARSSRYCTDPAKIIEAPVFHVNTDDPEAVIRVGQLALAYRNQFQKDVVIDLVSYRRHGHNEADEPAATQPLMYQEIHALPSVAKLYAQQLVSEQLLTDAQIQAMEDTYKAKLDQGVCMVEILDKSVSHERQALWAPFVNPAAKMPKTTGVSIATLTEIAQRLVSFPPGFTLQKQVGNAMEARAEMLMGKRPLDWGAGETLAYATLLAEGTHVRLCGQDSQRGTFVHRLAVLHDQKTGDSYTPLTQVSDKQARFEVYNSLLSEAGAMAFEYGYSISTPQTLVLWEAQFGDFVNGAQVVIDQFLSSAWQKWERLSGLVLLLPHGYEGMGPEHTSARLERFLQLCAQGNLQVCYPTTPAQMFHLLRRQILRPRRVPLVVMTPKSLLRHKQAVSALAELTGGEFQRVIPAVSAEPKTVKRVVLCTGKVYYDLLAAAGDRKDLALVRVEELYPFPETEIRQELARYSQANSVIWCQEEPKNQGAWLSLSYPLEACLASHQQLKYVGRIESASPAAGYPNLHKQQQDQLIQEALTVE